MFASVVSFPLRKLLRNPAFIVNGDPFLCKQPTALSPPPFILTRLDARLRAACCSFFRFSLLLSLPLWPSQMCRGESPWWVPGICCVYNHVLGLELERVEHGLEVLLHSLIVVVVGSIEG